MSRSRAQGTHNSRASRRSEAGLTLPELMITLSIVAIGTVIGSLMYTNWAARSDVKGAAAEVASTMNYARMAAMNRNTTTTVSLAMVGTRVQLSTNGLMQPTTMGAYVAGFTGGPVQFSSLGVRVGGGAGNQVVTLTSREGDVYSVVVTPGGKISWCPNVVAVCPM